MMTLVVAIEPDFLTLSTPLEYSYTGEGYRNELFRYRLFVPRLSPGEKRPLIVWLHGNCESHRDNVAHLRWLDQFVFRKPWDQDYHTFFLLAVQCPEDNFDWCQRSSAAQDDMVNVAAAILHRTLNDYPIDRERVYLSGVSSGGSGAWEFAIRQPRLFAAVAPLASGGGDIQRVKLLKNVPVWAFHSSHDTGTPISLVRATAESLKNAGGTVHLTEIDSVRHDCWTAAFNDYHLLDWLLSQRRGHPSPQPGTVPLEQRLKDFIEDWRWWQVLLQVGIPAVLIAAIWSALKGSGSRTTRRQTETGSDMTARPAVFEEAYSPNES